MNASSQFQTAEAGSDISSKEFLARIKKRNAIFFRLSALAIVGILCVAGFAVYEGFSALSRNLSDYEKKVSNSTVRVEQLDGRVSQLEMKINSYRSDIDIIKAAIDSGNSNLQALSHANIQKLTDYAIEHRKELDQQRKEIDEINSVLKCLRDPQHTQTCR
jgi:septal ring factor EnvC (AmiA/AmiB activator)